MIVRMFSHLSHMSHSVAVSCSALHSVSFRLLRFGIAFGMPRDQRLNTLYKAMTKGSPDELYNEAKNRVMAIWQSLSDEEKRTMAASYDNVPREGKRDWLMNYRANVVREPKPETNDSQIARSLSTTRSTKSRLMHFVLLPACRIPSGSMSWSRPVWTRRNSCACRTW